MDHLVVEVKDVHGETLMRYHVHRDGAAVVDLQQLAPSREDIGACAKALEAALLTTNMINTSWVG